MSLSCLCIIFLFGRDLAHVLVRYAQDAAQLKKILSDEIPIPSYGGYSGNGNNYFMQVCMHNYIG